jgi:hypothetical protein
MAVKHTNPDIHASPGQYPSAGPKTHQEAAMRNEWQ